MWSYRIARRCTVPAAILVLVVMAGAQASAEAAATRTSSARPDPLARGHYRVGVADYTLGDRAFTVPGLWKDPFKGPKSGLAPIELTGRVWYPIGTRRPGPLVIIEHGLWQTCADRQAALLENQALAAEDAWSAAHPGTKEHPGKPNPDEPRLDRIIDRVDPRLNSWPCRPGTPAMPSYRGFGYLGEALASHGITTVSISANGVNAVGLGDVAVKARAALIDKHLAMWATLDRTGRGALAGRFTRAGTSKPVRHDFRHTIDLKRIGTVGHSRAGKAVFWQAADKHRHRWPRGTRIRAIVSLAPEGALEVSPGTAAVANYRVKKLPFLVWQGTCDASTSYGGQDYLRFNRGRNASPHYELLVRGAEHNFLNQQWSPSSGQVEANDDVDELGVPRPVPGRCTEWQGEKILPSDPAPREHKPNAQRELGEFTERTMSQAYLTAFFLRELDGQRRWQPMLNGTYEPLHTRVESTIRTFPARA